MIVPKPGPSEKNICVAAFTQILMIFINKITKIYMNFKIKTKFFYLFY